MSPTESVIAEMLADHPRLAPCVPALQRAIAAMLACARADGLILTCGNGGSMADADHLVGELGKGFRRRRPLADPERSALAALDPAWAPLADRLQVGLRAICLGGASALATAVLNDNDPTLVFAQQVHAIGRRGDLFIGFTTSGNSANVVRAAQVARARGCTVIGFTGSRPSKLAEAADVCVQAPATETYRVQECHLPLYHALAAAVEMELYAA